ncbi:biotin/lipoyl-containing protein [Jeotgalicoccus sp. ATCC 8456]|uniref:acetyl-CoA carboxylase biotin carboxyl carrier protein n=1 Tax=Jeotgalicoccus sp. ATCC 8456 TaxID=946435 RepID=UPI0018E64E81|nr:biotin/lipoyl-containing protein [Jeotgalicoccus sp. ATCC 8456]QQD84983.1 biotin/lipoyl-binding protein [Jeotgalicoccus sp. ATCC 8456]
MNYKDIKKLVKLLKEEDLSVLSFSDESTSIHLERTMSNGVVSATSTSASTDTSANEESSDLLEIKASQLGTFFINKDENSEETFVAVGDPVQKGDQVGFIEAMKVFNDVKSDVAGTVEEILVSNGDTVEFGDVLIRLRPEGA